MKLCVGTELIIVYNFAAHATEVHPYTLCLCVCANMHKYIYLRHNETLMLVHTQLS